MPAAERAAQIANTLGNTQRFVTIGVTDTAEGVRIISSSENALRPAALNALHILSGSDDPDGLGRDDDRDAGMAAEAEEIPVA